MEMKFPDSVSEVKKEAKAKLLSVKSNRNVTANLGILILVLISACSRFLVPTGDTPQLKDIVFDTVLLYVISSLTYSIRYQVGIEKGKSDEVYKKTVAEFEEMREETQKVGSYDDLQEFCITLQKESLDACRKEILLRYGISLAEFEEKYLNKSSREIMRTKLSFRTKTALLKCQRIRIEEVSATDVLSSRSATQSSHMRLLGINGAKKQRRDTAVRSLKALLLTLFTGYYGFQLVNGFSMLLVLEWMFQMIPVVNAYLNGDNQGMLNITVTETCYKQNQTEILRMYRNRRKAEAEAKAKAEAEQKANPKAETEE